MPLQAPDAVQLVAFVELQVSVDEPPLATLVGFAVSETDGAGPAVTDTVTRRVAVPPVPVQASVNRASAVSAPVLCVPLSALVPLHAPEAVQLVAFVELHVSVAAVPVVTLVGVALSITVGAGTTVTCAALVVLPPAPVQVSV